MYRGGGNLVELISWFRFLRPLRDADDKEDNAAETMIVQPRLIAEYDDFPKPESRGQRSSMLPEVAPPRLDQCLEFRSTCMAESYSDELV